MTMAPHAPCHPSQLLRAGLKEGSDQDVRIGSQLLGREVLERMEQREGVVPQAVHHGPEMP